MDKVRGVDQRKVKLKPCPFCGSKSIFWKDGGDGYQVDCTDEGCPVIIRFALAYDTKSEAAREWNKRDV
jgi:hypothetical protein